MRIEHEAPGQPKRHTHLSVLSVPLTFISKGTLPGTPDPGGGEITGEGKKRSILNAFMPWYVLLPKPSGALQEGDQEHLLHLIALGAVTGGIEPPEVPAAPAYTRRSRWQRKGFRT